MILDGRVTVNGSLVSEIPCFVDLETDEVRVDGQVVREPAKKKLYILLNKPRGVVCTQRDPQGRPRAVDLIGHLKQRVYCVGRLDADSTGLILLTNDGALTDYLTHPRYGVSKVYVVEVQGRVTGEEIERLKKGVYLDGKRTGRIWLKVLRRGGARSLLELKMSEGRNREIRRILARLGHKVRSLKRTAIGSITSRGVGVGAWRDLNPKEVDRLRKCGKPARLEKPPRRG